MAKVRTLSELFRALGTQDLRTATVLATRIADEEERLGHRSAASLLRGALNSRSNVIQLPGPQFDIERALIAEKPGPPLHEVVLTHNAQRELTTLCAEWCYRHELQERGVPRRTKVVFSGPPGCGKTLTARSLGAELDLPVLTVRFSTLVGAYLGQTGANLRAAFAFAERTPCIFLLDEFDAIARTRGRTSDVGELDRIVISLLQELDHTAPKGIVIAATNAADAIDRAIWRRFDAHIEFPLPTSQKVRRFVQSLLGDTEHAKSIPTIVKSFADAEKWVTSIRRQYVIEALQSTNGVKKRA
jgi:SpoVK/Ycf46/Vps4 family AAA+-type ATPase